MIKKVLKIVFTPIVYIVSVVVYLFITLIEYLEDES